MPTAKVLDLTSKEVGEIDLPEVIFDVPLNEPLIHEAVRSFLANRRAGTSATKTRGDVSGAGRKLWKQKGTGRARIASLSRKLRAVVSPMPGTRMCSRRRATSSTS